MEIRLRLAKPTPGLIPTVIGICGLIAIAVSAGALIGNWWCSGLIGGVFAVAVAHLAGPTPAPVAQAEQPAQAPVVSITPIRPQPATARAV